MLLGYGKLFLLEGKAMAWLARTWLSMFVDRSWHFLPTEPFQYKGP